MGLELREVQLTPLTPRICSYSSVSMYLCGWVGEHVGVCDCVCESFSSPSGYQADKLLLM